MLHATWGELRKGALLRLAADRGLPIVEHGPLAVVGEELAVADRDGIRCIFEGRLIGVDPQACARELLDRYTRHGLASLSQLHGAYVAFVCDGEHAWVVRDRLGARTLSYSATGGDVALGGHDADVLELLPATPAPDRMAVVQWIEHFALPAGRSLFSGLRRLPAGYRLDLSARYAIERVYWQPSYEGVDQCNRGDLASALRDETFNAISRARDGARAPGLFLSGGLDSACVAAGLAHRGGVPTRALAITFPHDPDVDERTLIETTARFSGLPLTQVPFLDGEVLTSSLRHLQRWKVPPPSPMTFVWERVWALAREMGVDVVLDGQGGDEAFGALASKYVISDRLRAGRLGQAWRLSGSLPGPEWGTRMPLSVRLGVLRTIGLSGALPSRLQAVRRRRLPRERVVSRLVRSEDVQGLVAQYDPWSFKRRRGPLWWRATVAMFMDSPDAMDANGFLQRAAAGAGIERRSPFLHDVRLFERLLRTPPETGFDVARDRPLLRDALAGHVAEEIRTRHVKLLFNSIVVSRLLGEEGRRLVGELGRPDAPVREYVDGPGLEKLLDLRRSPSRDANVQSSLLFAVGLVNSWLMLLEGRRCGAGEGHCRS